MTDVATAPMRNGRGVPGFGMELQLDLAGCNPEVLDSADALIDYVTLLAERIGMTTYGKPIVEYFGEAELAGWTVIQLITTSNINLHAAPADGTAFINVFSCRAFDPDVATQVSVEHFGATVHTARVTERTAPVAP
jgi:S-adenosylmethionine decarboxylase